MDQRKLTCVCGQQFSEDEFARHYSSCQLFKQQFREFDSKFGELLKQNSEPKEKLLIVKFLLKQYINVIDKKLKKYFANLSQNRPPNQEGGVAPPFGYGAPPVMNNKYGFGAPLGILNSLSVITPGCSINISLAGTIPGAGQAPPIYPKSSGLEIPI